MIAYLIADKMFESTCGCCLKPEKNVKLFDLIDSRVKFYTDIEICDGK